MQGSSTADSAHVCTLTLAVEKMPLQRQIHQLERLLWPYRLAAMCDAATARVQQSILQAASEAYIALDIPPPDSHVIDVLMSLPGLAGVTLTESRVIDPCALEGDTPISEAFPAAPEPVWFIHGGSPVSRQSAVQAWAEAFEGRPGTPLTLPPDINIQRGL